MPAPKDMTEDAEAEAYKARIEHIRQQAALALAAATKEIQKNSKNQKAAAYRSGLDQPAFSLLANGKRIIGADKLAVMATMIGMSADALLGLESATGERRALTAEGLLSVMDDPVQRRRLYEVLHREFGTKSETQDEIEQESGSFAPTIPEQPSKRSRKRSSDIAPKPATKRPRSGH